MSRKMLINALYPEECRVAVTENGNLLELEIEKADQAQLRGNIYKAPISRIEPSLQAAFLDIGSNRNGFLQINDINPTYFNNWPLEGKLERTRPAIQDMLKPGQELVVQVVKDERAAKGATLTTNLSLPGRYLVLMIGNQRGGVSRKINDEGQRRKLRQVLDNLIIPAGMGVIVRTAGIHKSSSELQRDLNALLEIWHDIVKNSLEFSGPVTLYKESNLSIRTIRDYLTPDIDEILIDDKATFETASGFISNVMPSFADKIHYFEGPQPLFSAFHLDAQIAETSHPEVTLPSGGSIVINVTEAVVAIDVNSGRSTNQADVEHTAFQTNKEAAQVIAKQLRLRDLGGLIVIDFIDMIDRRHKQIVERTLKEYTQSDKAKIEIGRISKFGLCEMSRQRLKSSLTSQSHILCPHCNGRGRVRTAESAALEVLRKIQSAIYAGGIGEIRVHMSPAGALLLLNNKRQTISQFEADTSTRVLIYADGRMKPDEYEFELIAGKTAIKTSNSNYATSSSPAQSQESSHSRDRSRSRRSSSHQKNSRPRGENKPRHSRSRNRHVSTKTSRSSSHKDSYKSRSKKDEAEHKQDSPYQSYDNDES